MSRRRTKGIFKVPSEKPVMACAVCERFFLRKSANQRYCKDCVPDYSWHGRVMRYGVGATQWTAMLEAQGGTCKLCPNVPTVVDHDHRTGAVRGLLCHGCNTHLAALELHPDWLRRATAYLQHGGKI